jgi:ABC-type nickel/cobalt efflux system permease component RcnA
LGEDAHARAHAGAVSRWTLLTLGVSGGIVPCPAAITIFIFSMGHLKDLRLGLAFLISFSVGLGLVLTGIGVALILSKNILAGTLAKNRLFQTIPGFRNRFGATLDRAAFATGRRLPGLSAIFIMLLGNYMLLNTLFVMGVFGK